VRSGGGSLAAMVKFGDRMIDMQHAGWEAHYINYEELKLQIDNIERCQTDKDLEAKSDEVLATLKQMLVGVDAFVADQMSTLQAKTDLTDAKSLHSAKSFLKV
jgi:SPX domain protein involved in polyphosphate accumulation